MLGRGPKGVSSWLVTFTLLLSGMPMSSARRAPRMMPGTSPSGAACKRFQALLVIPFALRTVVFPLLAVYHREAPERLVIAVQKFFKALVALGLPASIGVIVLADQYTSLFTLPAQASPSLRLLGVTIVFMFADNANATGLLAMDRQRTYAWIVGAGLVLNAVLNAVLIPVFEHLHPGTGYLVTSASTAA